VTLTVCRLPATRRGHRVDRPAAQREMSQPKTVMAAGSNEHNGAGCLATRDRDVVAGDDAGEGVIQREETRNCRPSSRSWEQCTDHEAGAVLAFVTSRSALGDSQGSRARLAAPRAVGWHGREVADHGCWVDVAIEVAGADVAGGERGPAQRRSLVAGLRAIAEALP
jgi:hypothetical protein